MLRSKPATATTTTTTTGASHACLPQGKFMSVRMEIQLSDGRMVSGTEFERLAGRGAAKKWKVCRRQADKLVCICLQPVGKGN